MSDTLPVRKYDEINISEASQLPIGPQDSLKRFGQSNMQGVIVLCLIVSGIVGQIVPKNVSYSVKDVNFRLASLNFATVQLEYDEPLYLLKSTHCPAYDPSTATPSTSCVCDYTATSGNNSCSICTNCDLSICSTKDKFRVATLNTPQKFSSQDGVDVYMLYIPSAGPALHIQGETESGAIRIGVNVGKHSSNSTWYSETAAANQIVICPSHSAYAPGTYFISVNSPFGPSSYRLTIRNVALPLPSQIPTDVPCTSDSNGICLPANQPILISSNTTYQMYYKYNFRGCHTFSLGAHVESLGGDADIYMSFDTPQTYSATNDYSSYNSGDDYGTIRGCSPANSTGTLYVTVDLWYLPPQGNLQIQLSLATVFTNSSLWNMSLGGMLYYDSANQLLSSYKLILAGNEYYSISWLDLPATYAIPHSPSVVPFYPMPLGFQSLTTLTQNYNPSDLSSHKISIAVLLNYQLIDGPAITNFIEDQIRSMTFKMGYTVVGASGRGIAGGVSVQRETVPQCVYSDYITASQKIYNLTSVEQQTSNTDLIDDSEFLISVIQYSDDYNGCKQLLNGLVRVNTTKVPQFSEACGLLPTDKDFSLDPCCYVLGKWGGVCRPRNVTAILDTLSLDDSALQQYGSGECVAAVLNDYVSVSQDACAPPEQNVTVNLYASYRQCKENNYGTLNLQCHQDSDCSFYNSTCNVLTRQCRVDRAALARSFTVCLVNSMEETWLYQAKDILGVSQSLSKSDLSSFLLSKVNSPGCYDPSVGSISDLDRAYKLKGSDSLACDFVTCEDNSCAQEETTCMLQDINHLFYWLQETSYDEYYCNYDRTLCDGNRADCVARCNETDFCGWTEDGYHYNTVAADNSTVCSSMVACITQESSNQTVRFDLSEAACNSTYTCTTNSSITDATTCLNHGHCSLNDFLSPLGGCVIARTIVTLDSVFSNSFPLPYCNSRDLISIPQACINPELSESQCDSVGGNWVEPIYNEAACTAEYACYQLSNRQLSGPHFFGTTYAFSNQKNAVDCVAAGGDWRSKYTWTAGKWVPGTARKLQWTGAAVGRSYVWNNTVNFLKMQNLYFSFGGAQQAADSLSVPFCQRTVSQSYIDTVACSHQSSTADNCFQNISKPVLNVARVCTHTENSVELPGFAEVTFYNDADADAVCSSVSLYKIPMSYYRGTVQQTLASSFISFGNNVEFAVQNQHDATVAALQGDGLYYTTTSQIEIPPQICLPVTSPVMSYDVWDFASLDVNNNLVPMGLNNVFLMNYTDTRSGQLVYRLCAEVQDYVMREGVFPISRIRNWATVSTQRLNFTSFVLSNFLGALFFMAMFISVLCIGIAIYSVVKLDHGWMVTDTVLVFVTLFVLIRGISFFILPYYVLNSTVDYFLSALPTFLFFTSFSTILSYWVVMSSRKNFTADVNLLVRYGTVINAVINGILYTILIVLIILFASLVHTPKALCGGLVLPSIYNAQRTSRILSLVYASVTSMVSLVFGLLFLYYGAQIVRGVSFSSRNNSNRSRMGLMTISFSVCFILHCPFILLIAVFSENPKPFFSFFGLIVTEILPVSVFLLLNNRLLAAKHMLSSSGRSVPTSNMSPIPISRRPHSEEVSMRHITITKSEQTIMRSESLPSIETAMDEQATTLEE
ncbi:hypothetical protein PROFUN_05611 [Planoprotostelium fungivorum]|uniref:THH1/TOM1/TOM3 domain-containing protein n=1 Tax=Planoprotostelium fungivorum TaxID=1890364 RepID=A0A2P6N085_9EUKA|nr:hypothetical protein PROFUN_05611 [Planoprotostelium fungivorum]